MNVNASPGGSLISMNLALVNLNSDTLTFNVANNHSAPYDLLLTGSISDFIQLPYFVAGMPVFKNGPGLMVMSGSNTYAGPTTVAAGTLAINGQLTASPVSVNSGGVFSGTGTIGNLIQIASGGALSPALPPAPGPSTPPTSPWTAAASSTTPSSPQAAAATASSTSRARLPCPRSA